MYRELTITQNGILVGGRAYTSRSELIADLRRWLSNPPAGWSEGWSRRGFRMWTGCANTVMRLESFPR